MIKILAAARLLATRRRRLKARAVAVDQTALDLLMPVIFDHAKPVQHMMQSEKVKLRLPYPYGEIWSTSLYGNAVYVSASAEAGQLWVCAFFCNSGYHPLPDASVPMQSFVQPIAFNGGAERDAISAAYEKVQPRITKWYLSLKDESWDH